MTDLRERLQRLAEEAVPGDEPLGARLPSVSAETLPRKRPSRLVAAAALVVVLAAVVGVIARVGHDDDTTSAPSEPPAPRNQAAMAYTGRDVFLWGGRHGRVEFDDGARYDVATGRWRNVRRAPLPPRWGASAVWTGHDVIVVGGINGDYENVRHDGARYDPATDTWHAIAAAPICVSRATWLNGLVYAAGACNGQSGRLAAFDPTNNTWTTLPRPAHALGFASDLVALGGRYVVPWAMGSTQVFDSLTRTWSELPRWPRNGLPFYAAVENHRLFAVGNVAMSVAVAEYDPRARTWSEPRVIDTVAQPYLPSAAHTAAVDDGVLVWLAHRIGWYDARTGAHGTLPPGDEGTGALLALGRGRFFFWTGTSGRIIVPPVPR